MKVSKGNVSSELSVESGQVKITGNRLVVDSTNFKLDEGGNVDITGKITALSGGKLGGFSIEGNNLTANSSSTSIKWGDFYVNGDELCAGSVTISNEGLDIGYIGSIENGRWESNTGDIYVNEIYATDNSWMKGWGLFETVQELWEYVHGGGWNPCGGDDDCDSCGDCDEGCEEDLEEDSGCS